MAVTRLQTRRQRVEEKETAIIAAARRVFSEHGFDKAKIADIAKRAGVAEGTVYLYFENKNALLLAVAAAFYDRLTADAAAGIRDIAGTEAKLTFLARHHLERVSEEWLMLSQAMAPDKASRNYRRTKAYQLNRTYVEVFDQVIRRRHRPRRHPCRRTVERHAGYILWRHRIWRPHPPAQAGRRRPGQHHRRFYAGIRRRDAASTGGGAGPNP